MANKKSFKSPVYVTRTSLPPVDDYLESVRDIFSSGWLSNQGAYALHLEQDLAKFLAVPSLSLCSNGTLALQLGLHLLGLQKRKIITTPFTYVATLSSLLWEDCIPIFADIDPYSLCIDPSDVERCIKEHPDVAGILPVHVYGNACNISALSELAEQYTLKIFYDAAHAFGSKLKGKSLLSYGDAAICSFHATKLFHTVEGGCIVMHSEEDKERFNLLRAFGHIGDTHKSLGINAKISEFHAAMGLALLPSVSDLIKQRSYLSSLYDTALGMQGNDIGLTKPQIAPGLEWNYGHYPVIFPDHKKMLAAMTALNKQDIHPRRYFFPSLNTLPYIQQATPCPVSESMAERVLCLPFWPNMEEEIIERVAEVIKREMLK